MKLDPASKTMNGAGFATSLPASLETQGGDDDMHHAIADVRRLIRFLRPYGRMFVGGLFVAALSSVVGLMFPILFGSIIDATLGRSTAPGGGTGASVNVVFGLLLSLLALQAVLIHIHKMWVARAGMKGMTDLRRELYSTVVSQPMAFFSERRVGELTSRFVADLEVVQSILLGVVPLMVLQSIYLLGGLGLLTLTSWRLTVLLAGIFPLLWVAGMMIGKAIRRSHRNSQDLLADSNVVVEETLQGIACVKSFTMEGEEVNRYERTVRSYAENYLKGIWWRATFSSFVVMAMCGGLLIVLWRGMHLVKAGSMSPGELTRFVLYMVLAGSAAGVLADHYGKFQKMLGAMRRVCGLLGEEPETICRSPNASEAWPDKLRGEVEFRNVSFRYPSRPGVSVLKELSLKVEAGKRIALVGSSGAGKSTITALLIGFYQTDVGVICLDGKRIEEYPLSYLRRQMAIVPQDVVLFGGTIAENIGYGNSAAKHEEILSAARKAYVHDFIISLPDGYQTIVGERGVRLSGGQKQRIAIARAILRDPAILILDEATNALDAESEGLVQQALDVLMENRTTFIIAHRLATAAKADLIAVIDQGRVVETGAHAELVKKENGLYQKFSRLQLEI